MTVDQIKVKVLEITKDKFSPPFSLSDFRYHGIDVTISGTHVTKGELFIFHLQQ